ncbi:peptidoglycan D,D-transpeptidase FtsI family protein [Paenibacillus sp. DMB20]|uniref:peptidoglycan D,D-transpeptidase FtsI family protein n=1 Tax=Paenibacillus sp. DMB20 TaxID=1642570 RepID=UPI000AEDC456|nr:penicillin-binding protein 2 [Paenibacillus sp. DMB20]
MLWHAEGSAIPLALNEAQKDGIGHLDLPNLQVLPFEQRYGNRESGMQWLGFISGQRKEKLFYRDYEGVKGTSGLERTLDALLQGTGPTVVYFPVDGRNRIINEMKPMVKASTNPYYPLRFTATVDIRIQTGIEKLMEKAGIMEGAVVVQDTSNGDILAMVSRPFYNPEQIHPKEGQWGNKALQSAPPGSIFKIVTAAAALEAGVTSGKEKFRCSGEYGKYGLSCWKTGGHGTINLRQAFAESCNVAFAELAERLTSEQIQDTANKLGLGRSIGWEADNVLGLPLLKPLDHEESGTVFLPSTDPKDAGARVQTAIGQRDASVTPLQASNLMVTLLHDGKVIRPRIVSSISYANGQQLQSFQPMRVTEAGETISRETYHTLRKWMEDVVRQGTGRSLGRSVWKLAGKSGTAETVVNGIPRNNQWFVGYGPVRQPRYSVAVLVENVKPNSRHLATELFGQVMDLLALADNSSR